LSPPIQSFQRVGGPFVAAPVFEALIPFLNFGARSERKSMGWRHFMSRVHVVSDAFSRRFRPIPSGRDPLALGRALGSPPDLIREPEGRELQDRPAWAFASNPIRVGAR
jgi:hypothetical protein